MPAPSWVPLSVTRSPRCIAASHTLWLDGYKEAEVTGNLLSRQGARLGGLRQRGQPGRPDAGLHRFDPTGEVDVDAWVKTLRDQGFKMGILTLKHHDGFAPGALSSMVVGVDRPGGMDQPRFWIAAHSSRRPTVRWKSIGCSVSAAK